MIEPVRHDWPKIIREILDALRDKNRKGSTGRGKLAGMMRRRVIEIKQWEKVGRMQHYEGEMLLLIRAACCPQVSAHPSESPTPCQTSPHQESGERGTTV